LWALRGQNPRNIIDITWDPPASDARYCDHVRVLGHPFSPFAMPYENRTTFVFCEGLHPSLAALWHLTKNYN